MKLVIKFLPNSAFLPECRCAKQTAYEMGRYIYIVHYLDHLISLNSDGNRQEDTDTQCNVGSTLGKGINGKYLKM